MSSIDQVIARSRQQGEFTERKRFTVARANAIRKMDCVNRAQLVAKEIRLNIID